MANKIDTVTRLNEVMKSLDDLIAFYGSQKTDNPRTQMSVSFLSGTRSPHTYDIILKHAGDVKDQIASILLKVRGDDENLDASVQVMLKNFQTIIANDPNRQAHFMLGENGVLARIHAIFPYKENPAMPTVDSSAPTMQSLYVIACQRDKNWEMILPNLHKTIHSRPIHEEMYSAIHCLTDRTVAVIELSVPPSQVLRMPTPGGPTRISVGRIEPHHIKFLYDENYRHVRYMVEGNKLIPSEPHQNHKQPTPNISL